MSKKQGRIKYLVGIYNALNVCESSADGRLCYSKADIESVIATVKHLLKEDGITPLEAGKVEAKRG
ncbi:MAG: hypothetical protein ACRCXB_15015 [Aeromonadaceae bacterium]